MKVGVQIIGENWFESMTRGAMESLNKLTIIKPVVKHIPVETWSEIKRRDTVHYSATGTRYDTFIGMGDIRNSGGKTYLVTVQK